MPVNRPFAQDRPQGRGGRPGRRPRARYGRQERRRCPALVDGIPRDLDQVVYSEIPASPPASYLLPDSRVS